jgi:4-amino-4-deoxy-L-arabinose transferase-like glycosyltransferase
VDRDAEHVEGRAGVWLEALLLVALALAVRLPHIDHPGVYDEFYHTLAARSLLESGSLDTETFTYQRASIWTVCVAGSIALFGDTLVAARLPSVLVGCVFVLATWAFGRRVGGAWAGRIAALLLCLNFDAIYLSQIARFYPLHALILLGSAAALYFATARDRPLAIPARAVLLAGFLVLSTIAFKLSQMGAIAITACLTWVAIDLAPVALQAWQRFRRLRWMVLALLLLLVIVAVMVLPDPAWLYQYYRDAATYNEHLRGSFGFYLRMLFDMYPALCAVFPLAVLLALRSRPRFTIFAVMVFSIGLVLHSGAGRKEVRYLLWTLPFFFLVLGVAAATARPWFTRLVHDLLEPLRGRAAPIVSRLAAPLVSIMIVTCALGTNLAYRLTPELLATPTPHWPGTRRHYQPARWGAATPRLESILGERCVLVASSGVKALYYLDRLDYDLLRTLRDEHTPDHLEEFVIDHRTHKPTISEVGSLEEVRRRHVSGLVVIDSAHWAHPAFVPEDVAAHLEARFERVPVPADWRMRVYVWGRPGIDGNVCAPSPSF